MPPPLRKAVRRGRLDVFSKPRTSDPFINAVLTPVGRDTEGAERFWISTVNTLSGVASFLVNENGESRVYHWPLSKGFHCIYGVAPSGPDTLWLAGGRQRRFARLTLSTGEWESYPCPAGRFITPGMVFDPRTKKLFTGMHTAMASFDTRTRRFVRIYERHEMPPECFHHAHWRIRDGSYGFILRTPGLSYLRWRPKEESIEWTRLSDDTHHPALYKVYHLKYVRAGSVYLPHVGWLDPDTGRCAPHDPPPAEEANWFGRRGRRVYGGQLDTNTGDSAFIEWDTRSGRTRTLFRLADCPAQNCALTRKGKILTVDLIGVFRRHDAATGALELTRPIGFQRPHYGHTITPAGKDTIVGTPFIAQNFWILNTRTGKGHEAGRAAYSYGQIDAAVRVRGKVYFSAYGGSQLTEYDPSLPANFPRNPRLVAKSDQGQHGAGIATDGRIVWVAWRPRYGTLDGAMARYDTETGEATFRNAAIRNEHIVNPMYDPRTGQLVAGSSFLSDCSTATPTRDRCFAVTLDPDTMEVTKEVAAHPGVSCLQTVGPIGRRRWLMRAADLVGVFDEKRGALSKPGDFIPLPDKLMQILFAGAEGMFVALTPDQLLLWDFPNRAFQTLATHRKGFIHWICVHGRSVYCDCGKKVAILKNILPAP